MKTLVGQIKVAAQRQVCIACRQGIEAGATFVHEPVKMMNFCTTCADKAERESGGRFRVAR